jgi:hypothetical protein
MLTERQKLLYRALTAFAEGASVDEAAGMAEITAEEFIAIIREGE